MAVSGLEVMRLAFEVYAELTKHSAEFIEGECIGDQGLPIQRLFKVRRVGANVKSARRQQPAHRSLVSGVEEPLGWRPLLRGLRDSAKDTSKIK